MPNPTLTIFTLAHNLNNIKYPWKSSLASACYFADEVLVAECKSNDGTAEELSEIAKIEPKIKIVNHSWGTDCRVQKIIAENLTDIATSDWVFYLNADEVLGEWSDFNLKNLEDQGVRFGSAKYTHFLGNFNTTWPFIYTRAPRLLKGKGVEWSEDACGLDTRGERIAELAVDVQHFGKVSVGREIEAGFKETEFQKLYTRFGFPDQPLMELIKDKGRLDYSDFYKARWLERGEKDESKTFTGKHSKFVLDWKEKMESSKEVRFENK